MMKKKLFIYLAGFLILVMSNMTLASNGSDTEMVGTWSFTAKGGPEEYKSGEMVISSPSEGEYKCRVKFDDIHHTEKEAQDVKVAGNALSFNVCVSGEVVEISLNLNGMELTGKASYSEETAFIRASKEN